MVIVVGIVVVGHRVTGMVFVVEVGYIVACVEDVDGRNSFISLSVFSILANSPSCSTATIRLSNLATISIRRVEKLAIGRASINTY